jgi:phospholipid/cholesterol/gamma-HCH transport system substrate-binding protein
VVFHYRPRVPATEKRTELFVGLFVFIGLVLLGGLIVQFGRFSDHFGSYYAVNVVFDDASGVIKGSEVRMGGAQIGRVAKLPELNAAVQVEVELAINEKTRIPAGSKYRIDSASLLGDKLIVVVPPQERTGDFVKADSRHIGSGATGLDALQNNAEIVSRDVVTMVKDAQITMIKVEAAVDEIRIAGQQLKEAVGKVNSSLLAEKNLARFDQTLGNLAELSENWKDVSGSLEPTLADAREAIGQLREAATAAEKTLKTADETMADLKPALAEVPAAVNNISRTAKKAGDALDRMEEGEGLLGTVTSDEEVSTDAKVFVRNLRRYGILRYRNDKIPAEDDPRHRYRGKRR